MQHVETLASASAASQQTLVRERMNGLISEARRDALHAEMKEAAAQIYTAMGYDPFEAGITGQESIDTIANSLEALWTRRSETPAMRSAALRGAAKPGDAVSASVSP